MSSGPWLAPDLYDAVASQGAGIKTKSASSKETSVPKAVVFFKLIIVILKLLKAECIKAFIIDEGAVQDGITARSQNTKITE